MAMSRFIKRVTGGGSAWKLSSGRCAPCRPTRPGGFAAEVRVGVVVRLGAPVGEELFLRVSDGGARSGGGGFALSDAGVGNSMVGALGDLVLRFNSRADGGRDPNDPNGPVEVPDGRWCAWNKQLQRAGARSSALRPGARPRAQRLGARPR